MIIKKRKRKTEGKPKINEKIYTKVDKHNNAMTMLVVIQQTDREKE